MALIRLGSLVTRISGKIGGQTFGTGPAGSYIRNTGTPRKSITLQQREKMSTMATTAQSWRELTQPQRDIFNSASSEYTYLNSVGETKNYSGYAIYGMLVNNGLNVGFGSLPIPLPRFSFTGPITTSVTFIPTKFTFNLSNTQLQVKYRIFISRPASVGISGAYKNKFYIKDVTGSGGGVVTVDTKVSMETKWGAILTEGRFYYRIDAVSITTGQSLKGIANGVVTW